MVQVALTISMATSTLQIVGSDEQSDESPENNIPDPAERVWRHPSEIAAQARAAAETAAAAETPAQLRPGRPGAPAVLVAAGVLLGLIMVGYVAQGQQASPTEALLTLEPSPVVATLPALGVAIDASTTSTTEASVSTTYMSPIHEVEVARPAGVLRVFTPDGNIVLGSAVATDGIILTSASALRGHKTVWVSSSSEQLEMAEATLLGTDLYTDLAVLTTDASLDDVNLPSFALSENLSEGVFVIAGGKEPVTSAASGKILKLETKTRSATGYELAGLAATSVHISENDAGAGLFNRSGELIGVVVATKDYLASALPIEDALAIAQSLRRIGKVTPVWAGIQGSAQEPGGVLVSTVSPDSPAEYGGLLVGDVILGVDDYQISSMAELVHYVRALETGSSIELQVKRDSELMRVTVQLSWHG